MERTTNGWHRNIKDDISGIESFEIANEVRPFRNHTFLNVRTGDSKLSYKSVVGDRICYFSFPELEPDGVRTVRAQGLICFELDSSLLRQLFTLSDEVFQYRPS